MPKTKLGYFFWICITLFLINVHIRGIIPYDEGQILFLSERILSGEVPYRDFVFFYTPGTILTVAFFFKLLGSSILTGKIVAMIISLLSTLLIIRISMLITKMRLFAVLASGMLLLWGPTVINFVWPVMACIFFGLWNVYLLMKFSEKKEYKLIFLAGLAASLALLFKQNFGVAVLAANFTALFFMSDLKKVKFISYYFLGYLMPIVVFILYLIQYGSITHFVYQMYYVMFEKIAKEGMLVNDFIFKDVWYKQLVRTSFYLLPIIVCSISLFFIKKKAHLHAILFVMFYYILSIRPTTDFVHFAPMLSISSLPIAVIVLNNNLKKFAMTLALILVLLGIYNLYARGLYKWGPTLLQHNNFHVSSKTNVFLDPGYGGVLNKLSKVLDKSGEYIFVYDYSPAIYFIFSKKNPTKWDNLPPEMMEKSVQEQIVLNLEKKKVKTVITSKSIKFDNYILTDYIKDKFSMTETISGYEIWIKKH